MKRGGNNKGSVVLEFALGSGLLISAFLGAFQYGYIFYRYNTIENAVNGGARYAALRTYDAATATPSTAFLNAVKNVVVFGDPAGGSTPIAPGLTTAHVSVTAIFTLGVPTAMKVCINDYSINSVFASQTLHGKPVATYPFTGIYAPY